VVAPSQTFGQALPRHEVRAASLGLYHRSNSAGGRRIAHRSLAAACGREPLEQGDIQHDMRDQLVEADPGGCWSSAPPMRCDQQQQDGRGEQQGHDEDKPASARHANAPAAGRR